MCGMVGIAGDLGFKDEVTMKRLLVLDSFRGPDSTGLAAIRSSGEVKIAKVSSHPWDLFDMGKFRDTLNGTNSKAFMGHNRAATRGAVTHGNAHPFEVDHIVGMHNGTLDWTSVKNLEDALGEKFLVDSQALIAGIAKFGIKDAIGMCREGKDYATGAWSLVWYDSMEGSLNFLRNKHRPLWYGYTKDFKRLFWASEWPMIEAAARLGIGYELYKEEGTGYRFWQTDEDIHYRYDIDVLKAGSETRPKPLAKLVKGKEPLPVVTTSGGVDPFKRDLAGGTTNVVGFHLPTQKRLTHGKGSGNSKTTSHSDTGGASKIIHLLGDLHNPFGGLLTEDKFHELSKYGCSWCGLDLEWGDTGLLFFERDGIVLCPDCVRGDSEEDSNTRVYTRHELYM